jgi:hypothetical protein
VEMGGASVFFKLVDLLQNFPEETKKRENLGFNSRHRGVSI